MRIGDPSQPVILRFESTGGLGGSVQCDPVMMIRIMIPIIHQIMKLPDKNVSELIS